MRTSMILVLACTAGLGAQALDVHTDTARAMTQDLRAFADGSWFHRLLAEIDDPSPARRVSRIRERIQRALARHDDAFQRMPAARQQALLGEVLDILEAAAPIAPGSAPPRVVAPLESWRSGFRGHLVAGYTRAWESRTETLLRLLRTLRLLPGAENLLDGSLLTQCVRYVHERYGSVGDAAIADAQSILLHEFERFELALGDLDLEQRLEVWARWRLGLRRRLDASSPTAPATARLKPESLEALRAWSLDQALRTEELLRRRLLVEREQLRLGGSALESASPRLSSMLRRIDPAAIDAEARRWWCHAQQQRIESGGGAADPERTVADVLAQLSSDAVRARLRHEFAVIEHAVATRRHREAALRAHALDHTERALLRRQIWLHELERAEEIER